MLKNFIIVNGTMGVGKTTVCQQLKEKLPNAVFFDGDWAWDMSPFYVNETTKQMVMNNITYCLNQFIQSDEFENIIFCWVLHEQYIINELVNRLNLKGTQLKIFTLMIDETTLKEHIEKDVKESKRTMDVLERSIARLENYKKLDTIKIDVSHNSLNQTIEKMMNYLI